MDPLTEYTLVSNIHNEYFENNKSFSFSNQLPSRTNFSNYEIALEAISFNDIYSKPVISQENEPNVTEEATEENTEETKPDFFNSLNNDDEIVINQQVHNELLFIKTSEVFDNFVTFIKLSLEGTPLQLSITTTYDHGKLVSLSMYYTGSEEWQLIIESPLNALLGFTNTVFTKGEYTNDKPFDVDLFNSIALAERVGKIRQIKTRIFTTQIEQLKGDQLASSVAAAIVLALENADIEASFVLRKEKDVIEFQIQDLVKVRLSPFVNNYFGLGPDLVFEGEGSIQIPKNIVYPATIITAEREIDNAPRSCSKVIALCDLVQN